MHTLDSLRVGSFRHYWLAILLSSGVQWLQQVVVGWLTYDVSRSPFLTVLALGLGTMPSLLTGRSAACWPTGSTGRSSLRPSTA